MKTNKPVTSDDVYEFQDAMGTALEEASPNQGEFRLLQNYPNPFNPNVVGTRIEYTITVATLVRLNVYDLLGRRVKELVNSQLPAGKHSAVWNAEEVGSGLYFYRLEVGGVVETRPMMLAR